MTAATLQKWEGRWHQLKGRVKEVWGELTGDELCRAEGSFDRRVGLIEERAGQAREEFERRLDD